MTATESDREANGMSELSAGGSPSFEELVLDLDKREAELTRREAALVARETQLRIDTARQRNIFATAASRMELLNGSTFEEVFHDLPLATSLALGEIIEAARRQARSELRNEFDQLATFQAALAASAGRAAEPLVKAVNLRADHLERLLDEALARNRELAQQLAARPSEAEVERLADHIANRTAALIQRR